MFPAGLSRLILGSYIEHPVIRVAHSPGDDTGYIRKDLEGCPRIVIKIMLADAENHRFAQSPGRCGMRRVLCPGTLAQKIPHIEMGKLGLGTKTPGLK